jgi:hypothetical protein
MVISLFIRRNRLAENVTETNFVEAKLSSSRPQTISLSIEGETVAYWPMKWKTYRLWGAFLPSTVRLKGRPRSSEKIFNLAMESA